MADLLCWQWGHSQPGSGVLLTPFFWSSWWFLSTAVLLFSLSATCRLDMRHHWCFNVVLSITVRVEHKHTISQWLKTLCTPPKIDTLVKTKEGELLSRPLAAYQCLNWCSRMTHLDKQMITLREQMLSCSCTFPACSGIFVFPRS